MQASPPPPPSGTITFLFTDIQGSTRLWEQHPDRMRPALARHDELLRQAIDGNNGTVFKTIGDAFCAAFPTAPDALSAVLDAQLAVAAEPWQLPTPIRVRMALHTGAAEERGGDYFGPALNRVARLMAAGHGGQILLSLAVQQLTGDNLPAAVTLRDLGQRRLKDLGRPEHVFQVIHPALPADFPPLNSLDNPDLPNNLPQQVTSFIGREKQVAEVTALLGSTRLLTLTGAGGSGKTRLSLQVAADLLDRYFDGVWLVELAGLSDVALMPQAVADVLEVRETAAKSVQQALVEWLKPKRLLLILDNCEHLAGACASLAAGLLRACPGVHLLASSREPLNVTGEKTYRVPTLSLPDPRLPQTALALAQCEAVRLFTERAQAVQPAFSVTDANAPAVAQVCWRLDGIPLAIELAAARSRSLSAGEINSRLDQRFRLLTGGSRDRLPRQQTLQALIDWSYDLLTESEKSLLCRLSVFAGGWTLDAAESVCAGEGVEDWEVLDLLTSLVDKSLVVYEEEANGQSRSHLLQTVRQYAEDRLQESGTLNETKDRAASWFLEFAAEAEPQLRGPEQAAWLERIEAEHDNLRASLSWYENSEAGGEAGLRLAGSLWRFWSVRGHFTEGLQWLGKALERTSGREGEGDADVETLSLRSKALSGAGILARSQGDYTAARAFLEESLIIRRQLEDQSGIAASLNNLGGVAERQGDHVAARALFEESLIIKRKLGDQFGIGNALGNLGNLALDAGVYAAARALYEESLMIRRQLGDQQGIAISLDTLGTLALYQGDTMEARALLEESLTIKRRLGDQLGIANLLTVTGFVTVSEGNYAAARALCEEGLILSQQLGDKRGIIDSFEGMAKAASGLNQMARAVQLWGAASSLRDALSVLRPAQEQEETDRQISSARAALGEEAFNAAWDAGRAMTLEQAVEYALSDG